MQRSLFSNIFSISCIFIIFALSFPFIQIITGLNSSINPFLPNEWHPSNTKPTSSTNSGNKENNPFHDTNYPLIAFVKPVFTSAAYNGFYNFYLTPTGNPQHYLIQKVPDTWEESDNAPNFISALIRDGYPSSRLVTISDIDVHFGRLFNNNGTPKYDILVFFQSEYVTMDEYQNAINFVKTGGNIIVLSGNAFYAEIDYNTTANTATLIYGHNWQFDGHTAISANNWRFWGTAVDTEHFNWLGSKFSLYNAGPTSGAYFHVNSTNPHPIAVEMLQLGYPVMASYYSSYEDNTLITKNAHIIADWKTSFKQPDYGMKVYETFPDGPYGGSLIHFGFFGNEILSSDYASQLAFMVAVNHQMGYYKDPWIRYPMDGAVLNGDLILDYTNFWQTDILLNGISLGYLPPKTDLGRLPEGEYNLTIIFKTFSGSITRSIHFSIDRTPPIITVNTGSNSSLLLTYPRQPIQITSYDLHPSFLRIDANSGITPNYLSTIPVQKQQNLFKSFIIYPNNSGSFMTYNLTFPFTNGTWFFKITAFDTAGNIETYLFNVSINTFSNITGIIQPVITKINETTAYVIIPRVQPSYHAFLQTTGDSGQTWKTIPFINNPANPNESIAYLVKDPNSPRIWFRIGIQNTTILTYIPYIRTYQWDNAVIGVSATNMTSIVHIGNTYFIDFKTSQYTSGFISLKWLNVQFIPISQSNSIFINNISRYIFTVPTLSSGQYKLFILISFSTLNLNFSFDIRVNAVSPIFNP